MAATEHNITIEQGSQFKLTISCLQAGKKIKPLVGYLGRMQIREDYDSVGIIAEANPVLVKEQDGVVIAIIGATVTQNLNFVKGVYDVEIYKLNDLDDVLRIAMGTAKLSREVTR